MIEEKRQDREKNEVTSCSLRPTQKRFFFISGELITDYLFELDGASTQALLAYFT